MVVGEVDQPWQLAVVGDVDQLAMVGEVDQLWQLVEVPMQHETKYMIDQLMQLVEEVVVKL